MTKLILTIAIDTIAKYVEKHFETDMFIQHKGKLCSYCSYLNQN